MDPDPDPGHLFKIYWIFWTKQNFQICCLTFFVYFYAKTWWTIQKSGNFYNLSFSIVHIWVLRVNIFLQVLVDILPLGSGSVDPHICADSDPDPGIQNLLDLTDTDPKHCYPALYLRRLKAFFFSLLLALLFSFQ